MLYLTPASLVIAHVLIGYYFVFYGFWNIYHWRPLIEDLNQRNIPLPYMVLAAGIFWQTVAGFMIMFAIYLKLAALVLIPFTLISVFIFHPFWKFHGEKRALNLNIFLANLTLSFSALLLLLNSSPIQHFVDILS
jgi:putative oxidoreductase